MLCRGRALNFASGFQGVENSHYPRQGGSEGETQGALLSPCQQSMMKFYGKGAAADREATSTVQYRDRRPRSSLAGCSSCRAFVLQCNTRRSCPSRHTAAPAASCPSRRRHHRQGHRDRRTRSSPPTSEPPPPRRSNEQNSTVRPRLASSRTPLNAIRAAAGTPTFPRLVTVVATVAAPGVVAAAADRSQRCPMTLAPLLPPLQLRPMSETPPPNPPPRRCMYCLRGPPGSRLPGPRPPAAIACASCRTLSPSYPHLSRLPRRSPSTNARHYAPRWGLPARAGLNVSSVLLTDVR